MSIFHDMNERLKRRIWDFIRPIHRPITRRLRRLLGRNYFAHPEMELPPPYEAVQLDVERHLHEYLHVPASDIRQIVIVGTHEGDEIGRLLGTYPNARFLCFEPNPTTYGRLVRAFQDNPCVTLSEFALSDTAGTALFYELDMPGNGSLLRPDVRSWAQAVQREDSEVKCFSVRVSTLDNETSDLESIDLLWMDVQGAEGKVLDGSRAALNKVNAVFLEVTLVRSPYEGALLFHDISAKLNAYDFMCVGLGIDPGNGSGNALFVRHFNERLGAG